MSGVSDDRKRRARSGDDERYKRVENEFCGEHSTFFPRRFDQIAFVGSKIAKPLKTPPHLKKIVANPRTPKGLFTASVNVFLAAQDGVHFALGIRQQDRLGGPHMRFSTQTAPTAVFHLKPTRGLCSREYVQERGGLGLFDDDRQNYRSTLGRCPQTVETALVFYQPQFRGGGGGIAGSLTSINCVLQEYFSPTASVKMHPNL